MNALLQNALRQYSAIGVRTSVEDASPHRLIQMLMEGALSRIGTAIGHLEAGRTADKGRQIGLAISVIGGLQSSLDMKAGGDVAVNLDRLYDYMTRRLLEANLKNDAGMLAEVRDLLLGLKEAWDAVPEHLGPPDGPTPDAA
jgi:flagellar protein FliS